MFLKISRGLTLVSDDAVSLGRKYPANNDDEEEDVEENNAEEGEVEEKEKSLPRFPRTDEAPVLLPYPWVENVEPGSLSKVTGVPGEKGMEGSKYGCQKKGQSKAKRRRNSHEGVVRVDGWGVVPGEDPNQVESKSKNPEECRGEGCKGRPVGRKYFRRPRKIQKVLCQQQQPYQG